ncbi:MAG: sarcosine oxidase subunit gamma family protein [Litoreibacter sp.]
MFKSVSALQGDRYDGFVRIAEKGMRGMITIRGDLSDRAFCKAVEDVAGVEVPGQGMCNTKGDKAIAWMSPDEILVMMPYAEALIATRTFNDALMGSHGLVVNVSDARAVFRLQGADVRDVIAKLCPVDASADALATGQVRRTRLAQIAAAFWMVDETTLDLICFRSVAQYAFDVLSYAARPGTEVEAH